MMNRMLSLLSLSLVQDINNIKPTDTYINLNDIFLNSFNNVQVSSIK